jgi:imidazolonepropionase-like amidohydrolase
VSWPDAGYAERSGSLAGRFQFLRRFARALQHAGVPLVAGTDAPTIPGVFAGVSLHEDLQALVEAGFTNFEALSAATRVPGEFIRSTLPSEAPFGVIAPGMRADLILSSANPLSDLSTLRSPQGVMVAGHWHDAAALHQLLTKTSARYDRASLPAPDGAEIK